MSTNFTDTIVGLTISTEQTDKDNEDVEKTSGDITVKLEPHKRSQMCIPAADGAVLMQPEVLRAPRLRTERANHLHAIDAATQVTQKRTVSCRNSSERERESASTE